MWAFIGSTILNFTIGVVGAFAVFILFMLIYEKLRSLGDGATRESDASKSVPFYDNPECLPKKTKDSYINKIETTIRKDRYNNRDVLELTPELIIKYEDRAGVVTTRTLSNIRYKNSFQFNAYCHLRKEKRTFLNSSVIVATNPSGNAIDELSVKWGENGLRRTIYF